MAENSTIPLPQLRLGSKPQEEWLAFKQQYRDYSLICKLSQLDKEHQAAIFRTCLGREEMKIYNNLQYSVDEDRDDIALVIKKLEDHIIGEINETYERFKFNKRDQKEDESIHSYVTALRELIRSCGYGDPVNQK